MADSPDIPDPNKAAMAGLSADVANFPMEWMVNSLAQMGGKATIGGQEYDFTGLGNADVSAKMSDQMAQALLDIQRNYGEAYIRQRLADLKQADPTGYAARQQLFDKILADSKANPNRPLAEDLQSEVNSMLQSAGQLDKRGMEQVQQGVRGKQVARGIFLGNAPTSQEATAVVQASQNLRDQQQAAAQSYLQSGISPEDVEYRRIQQSLANLGAFANGTSPQAQFGSLSGAQNGAAPFNPVNYSNPASLNMGQSAQAGINFANSIYQTNNQQANPWLGAATTGINALGAYQNLGGQMPWVQTPMLSNTVGTNVGGTMITNQASATWK